MKAFLKDLYKRYVQRPIAAIEFTRPVWLFLNRKSHDLYIKNPPTLNPLQKRIVDELKRDGMSITHIDELFADQPEIYQDILKRLPDLVANAKQDPKKAHFKALWDTRSFHLDPKNGFTQFALSPKIIDISNAYFEMQTRLLLSNGYLSEVAKDGNKINTQNWHRDAHDIQLVSVFLYLTDVNSEADGALWYIKKSHPFGKLHSLFPQRKPHSLKKFPPESEVDARVEQEEKFVCTGRKGTIIFNDATGIHRGGHCTANRRVMVLTAYTSDHRFSGTSRLSYEQPIESLKATLSPQGLYAARLE